MVREFNWGAAFKGGSLVKSIVFLLLPAPFFEISSQDFIQSKSDSISLEFLVK